MYIVMEWRQGVSAATVANELRESSATSDRRQLLQLCVDIAGAYAALHERGILHGDVHERNLLVDASGGVTILDFGLSRSIDVPEGRKGPPRGGVGYFEPEYVAARRDKTTRSPSNSLRAVPIAALLTRYFPAPLTPFSLDHKEAMRQIAEEPTLRSRRAAAAAFSRLKQALAAPQNCLRMVESARSFAGALRQVALAAR
jgi:serine/threonine-protein kinase